MVKTRASSFLMETWDSPSVEEVDSTLAQSLPYSFCRENQCLPLWRKGNFVFLAMSRLDQIYRMDELRLFWESNIEALYCPWTTLEPILQKTFERNSQKDSKLPQKAFLSRGLSLAADLLDTAQSSPIVTALNKLLHSALESRASDIHLEPSVEGLGVRFRIDGVLTVRPPVERALQEAFLARLKILADLDLSEKRLPQDGRIGLSLGNREIDFRVSTIPLGEGERAVIRVLDPLRLEGDLGDLGLNGKSLEIFQQLIHQKEGLVLLTGPTGSGKTTTLYKGLRELDAEKLNIVTIEDPVEYDLPGISQINVHPEIGLTFFSCLKHSLRQDPDVILVGEIRDQETAETAVQAALTGHLVLGTLHTNDAPGAVTRLLEMGIEPYLIQSCLKGAIAQRLLRLNCPHCKEAQEATAIEQNWLGSQCPERLWRGVGCKLCGHTGFLGRKAIFEIMLCEEKQSLDTLQSEKAKIPLEDSGKEAVVAGETCSEEVFRILGGDPR